MELVRWLTCKSQRGLWLLFCAKGSEGDEDADADDSGDFGDIDGDGDGNGGGYGDGDGDFGEEYGVVATKRHQVR